MDGMRFIFSLHGHGTLAANMVANFKVPCDCTLVALNAVATTAAVGTLIVGTAADDDGYLTAFTVGASGTPTSVGRGGFTGALNTNTAEGPHILKGTILLITITHNSMINPDFQLIFTEG